MTNEIMGKLQCIEDSLYAQVAEIGKTHFSKVRVKYFEHIDGKFTDRAETAELIFDFLESRETGEKNIVMERVCYAIDRPKNSPFRIIDEGYRERLAYLITFNDGNRWREPEVPPAELPLCNSARVYGTIYKTFGVLDKCTLEDLRRGNSQAKIRKINAQQNRKAIAYPLHCGDNTLLTNKTRIIHYNQGKLIDS
jgi:hypothetical protein